MRNIGRAQLTSWVKKQLKVKVTKGARITGQRSWGEIVAQRETQRFTDGPLKYSAEWWSKLACKGIYLRPGRNSTHKHNENGIRHSQRDQNRACFDSQTVNLIHEALGAILTGSCLISGETLSLHWMLLWYCLINLTIEAQKDQKRMHARIKLSDVDRNTKISSLQ